jgi:RNA polymerase sigma factor (TIGR02999 family)
MSEVTRLIDAAAAGDRRAAADLLPLVYDELRTLAAARMSAEPPGHTLDATALVHEAYLRLVGPADADRWENRGHFFAAAAEAMRRILVEAARRKKRGKHGGLAVRQELGDHEPAAPAGPDAVDLLALNDALDRLRARAPRKAELVSMRYFAGCTLPEAAAVLGISPSTAEDDWAYAKAWLRREMLRGDLPAE